MQVASEQRKKYNFSKLFFNICYFHRTHLVYFLLTRNRRNCKGLLFINRHVRLTQGILLTFVLTTMIIIMSLKKKIPELKTTLLPQTDNVIFQKFFIDILFFYCFRGSSHRCPDTIILQCIQSIAGTQLSLLYLIKKSNWKEYSGKF